jgi:hypothetical protein
MSTRKHEFSPTSRNIKGMTWNPKNHSSLKSMSSQKIPRRREVCSFELNNLKKVEVLNPSILISNIDCFNPSMLQVFSIYRGF